MYKYKTGVVKMQAFAFDEGMTRTHWQHIRERVQQVEPKFARIVDKLDPDESHSLYLAFYPYGSTDADTISSLFPAGKGHYYRLTDAAAPKEVVKQLGYSKNNTPLGMVLDKELECFIDLRHEGITLPWLVYTPGKIFPFSRVLSHKSQRIYAPNGLLSSTAGARSAFMLPNIGSATNHSNLRRDFNVKSPPPKSLYEHWHVFKEIVQSEVVKTDWRCCIMYFGEKWITKIHNDKTWAELKHYLHELAWEQYEYERNRVHYDITFSMIQKRRNLKPNPYLADTARHLFAAALGAAPSYIPATNDQALPVSLLQKVFIESYGLKKYIPTMMHPTHYRFEKDTNPIYYSLQHPSTHVFSPKSREAASTLFEIRELEHIIRIFVEELAKDQALCSDTVIGEIAKKIEFNYFHNKSDRHRIVQPSTQIASRDRRFKYVANKQKSSARFASDAPFVRGCISITTKR
jgi:hypothetical protein